MCRALPPPSPPRGGRRRGGQGRAPGEAEEGPGRATRGVAQAPQWGFFSGRGLGRFPQSAGLLGALVYFPFVPFRVPPPVLPFGARALPQPLGPGYLQGVFQGFLWL